MVKFCDKCGHELKNENAKFCDKCGAEVKISTNQTNNGAATTGGTVICPHCGQATPMEQEVCVQCGSYLEDNTIAIIVGYIVTFLIPILGLIPGIYLLTRDNKKSRIQGINILAFLIVMVICNIIFSFPLNLLVPTVIFVISGVMLWYYK